MARKLKTGKAGPGPDFSRFEHMVTWFSPCRSFRLELFETNERPERPRTICETYLAYRLFCRGKLIFEGDRYLASPSHSVDGVRNVQELLGWLSLKPGDTDSNHFADYTPAQFDFAVKHGPELSLYSDRESSADVESGLDYECDPLS